MAKQKICVNLDCDDFHMSNMKCLKYFERLCEEFPGINITFFMPSNYHGNGEVTPGFMDSVKEYLGHPKNWISYGLHGFLHLSPTGQGEHELVLSLEYFKAMMNGIKYLPYDNVFRPPGWMITHEILKYLKDTDWVIAGHPNNYNNISFINIHESIPEHLLENVVIHSHASSQRRNLNGIDTEASYQNTQKIIQHLHDKYEIIWVTSKELYLRGKLK